jgi:hypothetical protein
MRFSTERPRPRRFPWRSRRRHRRHPGDHLERLGVVVIDPGVEDVEAGEVLVAAATDKSWCSTMYVYAALVVDISGALRLFRHP